MHTNTEATYTTDESPTAEMTIKRTDKPIASPPQSELQCDYKREIRQPTSTKPARKANLQKKPKNLPVNKKQFLYMRKRI